MNDKQEDDVARDLQRLRLATERYWEMQGLRQALVGIVFAVVFGGLLLSGLDPVPGRIGAAVALGALAAIVAGMLWLDRYYARVFGRLQPTRAARRFAVWIVPGTLIALMWLHPLVGAPPYSLYFLGWAVFAGWIAWRDWPLRAHHLLDAAAGLVAGVVQWQAAAVSHPTTGFLWGLVLIGTAGAVTGLRDHRLLQDILRPSDRMPPASGPEPVNSSG
jgi:hypothetical protein